MMVSAQDSKEDAEAALRLAEKKLTFVRHQKLTEALSVALCSELRGAPTSSGFSTRRVLCITTEKVHVVSVRIVR